MHIKTCVTTLVVLSLALVLVSSAARADDTRPGSQYLGNSPTGPLASNWGAARADDDVPAGAPAAPLAEPPPPPPPPAAPVAPTAPGVIVIEEPAPSVPVEQPTQRLWRRPTARPLATTSVACVAECGQRRDDCCWPLDLCGNRYGRTEITLEGSYAYLNSPEGLLGEVAFGEPDQFSWDALDYKGSFGGRGGIKYATQPQEWFELRGAYYGSWDDAVSVRGVFGYVPGAPIVGGGHQPSGVSDRGVAVLSSDADAWGVELNFISEASCSGCFRWDIIGGARYFQFNEVANATFATPLLPGFTGAAFVNSDVENMFVGAQLGGAFHWDVSKRIEFTGAVKAMFGNLNRKVAVTDRSIFSGGSHASSAEEDELVFGLDVDLGFRWRLSSRIALTFGYNLFFLDNVIRANGAMDFSHSSSGAVQATQTAHDLDQLLIHSVFLGFNFNF